MSETSYLDTETAYWVIPTDDAISVEVVTAWNEPITVSPFATAADVKAWIAEHRRRVQSGGCGYRKSHPAGADAVMGYLRFGMIDLLKLLGGLLVGLFRSHAAREAEMAFLRQQLVVLQRSAPARLRLRPSVREAAVVFKPETLVRWHRSGFRLYWRWKSRRRVGRPAVPADIRDLIRRISRDNPLWGAPRIHGELLKLGIDIAQSTVAKYMSRRHGPRSPGWQAFLRNHTAHIAGVDLFVVPTIGFKLLYGLVILGLERRRLLWTNVTANPTAEWIAQQISEAFPWDEAPRYLIRDRDTWYGAAVTRRLQAMGIRDRPIMPRSPWQNGHVERLIGSIRRG